MKTSWLETYGVCPDCRASLYMQEGRLACSQCRRLFFQEGGVWIFLPKEAVAPSLKTSFVEDRGA